jgi:V/A-type H+-transporting ATPase subunit D
MAKLRLTKNELKKQKDSLKRFKQYLPTLLLKKQQLQSEILKLRQKKQDLKQKKAYFKAKLFEWVDVFSEKTGIEKLVSLDSILTETGNIAGIDIPVFTRVKFREEKYDLRKTPLWTDFGIRALKEMIEYNARLKILEEQNRLVREELRITTQRVNLFEKVMIPGTKENIKKIQIYLGDLQTAAVVTGKIAKDKILKKQQALSAS